MASLNVNVLVELYKQASDNKVQISAYSDTIGEAPCRAEEGEGGLWKRPKISASCCFLLPSICICIWHPCICILFNCVFGRVGEGGSVEET